MMKKLTSRKFLMSLAAFLGSIGVSIAGLSSDNDKLATVGIICSILSAAIYAAAEAYVDGKHTIDVDELLDMFGEVHSDTVEDMPVEDTQVDDTKEEDEEA